MADRALEQRVAILEQKVEALEKLPDEMRAFRGEMADFRTEFLQFRDEIRSAFSAVASRSELSSLATELHEVRDAVMAQSRVLYEELKEQLKWIAEHQDGKSDHPGRS